jgi:hypothetical protein
MEREVVDRNDLALKRDVQQIILNIVMIFRILDYSGLRIPVTRSPEQANFAQWRGFSADVAVYQPYGTNNFEVALTFKGNLWTPFPNMKLRLP